MGVVQETGTSASWKLAWAWCASSSMGTDRPGKRRPQIETAGFARGCFLGLLCSDKGKIANKHFNLHRAGMKEVSEVHGHTIATLKPYLLRT